MNKYIKGIGFTLLSLGLGLVTAEQANAHHIDLGWESSLRNLGLDKSENLGRKFDFECLPAPASFSVLVYGNDSYTSQSYICPAAVHAGVITRDGGFVTVKLNPGKEFYASTERNGLSTRNSSATDFSYSFVGKPVAVQNQPQASQTAPATIQEIGWTSSINNFGLDEYPNLDKQFTFECTPAPASFSVLVYGTDNYTTGSYICPAAVHAGVLTRDGGLVTLQINAGQELYASTERNGLNSRNSSATDYSYFFIGEALAESNNRTTGAPSQQGSDTPRRPGAIEEGARRGIEKGVEDGVRDALGDLF